MSAHIAQNARIKLCVSRTVQIEQYSPFRFEMEVSSDLGDSLHSKEDVDGAVNDLSDYIMTKFDEEFGRHLQAQKTLCTL